MSEIAWYTNLRTGLRRRQVVAHCVRILLSAAVAVPVIVLGTYLLHYEVSQQSINPVAAFAANWPLITLLSFTINWFIWMDRGTGKLEALRRWIVASLAHTAISYSSFALMVMLFGWPYLYVSLGLTGGLGMISYVLRNLWVFAKPDLEDRKA